jgi:hypothetical protein
MARRTPPATPDFDALVWFVPAKESCTPGGVTLVIGTSHARAEANLTRMAYGIRDVLAQQTTPTEQQTASK